MKPAAATERVTKRPPLAVRVVHAEGPPVDLDAWVREYVRVVLELEGVQLPVAGAA
jgi:hypothetical protein